MSSGSDLPDGRAEEVLSPAVLEELRTVGGDQLVRELMVVFAERTPERLRAADAAFATGDLEGTAAAVHSLRSASGTVGARRLADLAGQLERAAKSGSSDGLAEGLAELRREADAVLAAANRLANSL